MDTCKKIVETTIELNLLKQIRHFELLKESAEKTLNELPSSIRITVEAYRKRVLNYESKVLELRLSYTKFRTKIITENLNL